MTHIFDTLGVLFDRYALHVLETLAAAAAVLGLLRIAMEIQHRGRWK